MFVTSSSTGEEPYSMAITLAEAFKSKPRIDYRILATDINTQVLAKAKEGCYAAERVEPVPRPLRIKYFDANRGTVSTADRLTVKQSVRDVVVFKRLNLATPPFPMQGPLDAVFCRNVMIYFDAPTRQRLVSAIEDLLRPGGFLAIGHTETLNGLQVRLKMVRPSVFVLPG